MEVKTGAELYYDTVARHYDSLYNDPLSEAENNIVAELLFSEIVKKGSTVKILDLGCGTGLAYELLVEKCRDKDIRLRYHGIDISSEMIKNAIIKHGNEDDCIFEVMNMDEICSLDSSSYDIVCSLFGSFSHAMQYEKLIKDIHRVLKPDGRIFLMLYSRYSLRNIRNYILNPIGGNLNFLQLYNVRNNDSDLSCNAYFYSTCKIFNLLKNKNFKDMRGKGLNILFELPLLKNYLRGNKYISLFLKNELFSLGYWLPDLGHSLIIEATCQK